MKERKKAGHLIGAQIVEAFDCVVVTGRLLKDQRGTHHHGAPRDFTGSSIHTSWLERVEYVETADTTVIYTRNSIYFAQGNIIEPAFGAGKFSAEGKAEMKKLFTDNLFKQKPEVDPNVTYELTEEGAAVTGEDVGAYIKLNAVLVNEGLCAANEVPFTLVEDMNSTSVQDTFFLNRNQFKHANHPLKKEL